MKRVIAAAVTEKDTAAVVMVTIAVIEVIEKGGDFPSFFVLCVPDTTRSQIFSGDYVEMFFKYAKIVLNLQQKEVLP